MRENSLRLNEIPYLLSTAILILVSGLGGCKSVTLRMHVTDIDGAPIPDALVLVHRHRYILQNEYGRSTRTDVQGDAVLEASEGDDPSIFASGYYPASVHEPNRFRAIRLRRLQPPSRHDVKFMTCSWTNETDGWSEVRPEQGKSWPFPVYIAARAATVKPSKETEWVHGRDPVESLGGVHSEYRIRVLKGGLCPAVSFYWDDTTDLPEPVMELKSRFGACFYYFDDSGHPVGKVWIRDDGGSSLMDLPAGATNRQIVPVRWVSLPGLVEKIVPQREPWIDIHSLMSVLSGFPTAPPVYEGLLSPVEVERLIAGYFDSVEKVLGKGACEAERTYRRNHKMSVQGAR